MTETITPVYMYFKANVHSILHISDLTVKYLHGRKIYCRILPPYVFCKCKAVDSYCTSVFQLSGHVPIEKCGFHPTSRPGIDPTLNRVPTRNPIS